MKKIILFLVLFFGFVLQSNASDLVYSSALTEEETEISISSGILYTLSGMYLPGPSNYSNPYIAQANISNLNSSIDFTISFDYKLENFYTNNPTASNVFSYNPIITFNSQYSDDFYFNNFDNSFYILLASSRINLGVSPVDIKTKNRFSFHFYFVEGVGVMDLYINGNFFTSVEHSVINSIINNSSQYFHFYFPAFSISYQPSAYYSNLTVYSDGLEQNLECTTETIPNYEFLNIFPTSSGAINEIIENSGENTYAVATTDMQAIFFGVENVSGFSELITSTGSMQFSTENNTPISSENTILSFLSIQENIQYIKVIGNYGNVDIFIFDNFGNVINSYYGIDLAEYSEGQGFPVGGLGKQVSIIFENSFFSKNIDLLELYTIGSNTTKEVEICVNPETEEYTIDGESYEGDPYTDLVGEATPTEITFEENGFQFFENGFCISDFRPFPSGGELFFQIQNPEGELKTTYSLYSTGLRSYGVGKCYPITTNYHTIEGQYYVRAVYKYQNAIYYPMGENWYQYTISAPEQIPNSISEEYWETETNTCDSSNTFGSISVLFCKMDKFFEKVGKNVSEVFEKVGDFFSAFNGIVTDEVNEIGFLYYSAHAETGKTMTSRIEVENQFLNGHLTLMYTYLYVVLFIVCCFAILGFYLIVKK